jgi:hypothetical protein
VERVGDQVPSPCSASPGAAAARPRPRAPRRRTRCRCRTASPRLRAVRPYGGRRRACRRWVLRPARSRGLLAWMPVGLHRVLPRPAPVSPPELCSARPSPGRSSPGEGPGGSHGGPRSTQRRLTATARGSTTPSARVASSSTTSRSSRCPAAT